MLIQNLLISLREMSTLLLPFPKTVKILPHVLGLLLRQVQAAQGIGAAVLDLGGCLLNLGLGLILQVRAAGRPVTCPAPLPTLCGTRESKSVPLLLPMTA